MRKISEIFLHCSATEEGKDIKAKTIKEWHVKGNGWKDIGYHFVIDLDGTVEVGRPISQVGAHCSGHNSDSIGICYIGGLRLGKAADTRTVEQKEAMLKLVKELMEKYNITLDRVHCHNEYAAKACPCFKINDFRNEFLSK